MNRRSPLRLYEQAVAGAAPYPGFFMGTYMNYGYWENGTCNRVEACETLLRKLIAPMTDKTGRILDVGCGAGFTTRFLCTVWNPEHVYGIDISEELIARCRENAPKYNFAKMDATALEFENESFDNLLSVEAVFHFRPRRAFYREALRVLKPGGVLALTDFVNRQNSVPDYRARLLDYGFSKAHVEDFTANGADSYFRFMFRKVRGDRLNGRCGTKEYSEAVEVLASLSTSYRQNLMAFAWK